MTLETFYQSDDLTKKKINFFSARSSWSPSWLSGESQRGNEHRGAKKAATALSFTHYQNTALAVDFKNVSGMLIMLRIVLFNIISI